jgi:uridine phosphorylase
VNKRETLIAPSDFIKYVARIRKCPLDKIKVPSRLLVTYQTRTYERARNLITGKSVGWWVYEGTQPFCVGSFNNKEIGAIRLFVGAPAAAMALEEVIACGARTILEVGFAGGLQPFLQAGSITVITEAVRDEGTSHHYLPLRTKTVSSERLKNKLIDELNEQKIAHFVGSVWSTDGVYRETLSKFKRFRKAGILCVDMETSAVFAVANYRNVEAASAQVISDILTENEWQPHFFTHRSVRKNTGVLLKAALKTLADVPQLNSR